MYHMRFLFHEWRLETNKTFWAFVFAVDWIIADMLAIRQNALGHVRYVLKDGLKWLPLYGWYFSQVSPFTFSLLFVCQICKMYFPSVYYMCWEHVVLNWHLFI